MARYTKLIVLSMVQNQAEYNFSNAPIPEGAKVVGVKNRKTGKTRGAKVLEDGTGYTGLVMELKRQQVTIHEIPLSAINDRSSNGDCMGYRFQDPILLTWGDTGTRVMAYDAANITTGKAVELEIEYEL